MNLCSIWGWSLRSIVHGSERYHVTKMLKRQNYPMLTQMRSNEIK